MKKTLLATTALMMYGTAATAGQTFVEVPVIRSIPIQQTSEIRTPQKNCAHRMIHVDDRGRAFPGQNGNIIGTIIGSALGGFVGSNIGKGKGQLAATAIGVLGGASVGRAYSPPRQPQYVNREVCETSYKIQHVTNVVGYNVTYNFEGQVYTSRMQTQPGNSIRLLLNTTHSVSQ